MLGMEYRNDFSQYLSRDYAYPDGRIDSASSVRETTHVIRPAFIWLTNTVSTIAGA
jgi:hypothetical protein